MLMEHSTVQMGSDTLLKNKTKENIITKQKQAHREQVSGCKWGKRWGRGSKRKRIRGTNY